MGKLQKRDMGGMKQAELATVEAEKKFRTLIETLPQAIFEYDFEGNILYSNRAGFDMFGYEREDMKTVSLMDLIDPSDHERVGRAVVKMFDGRSDGATREYMFIRKDGSTFPGRAYTILITNKQNGRLGVRGILTDITEEKEAEQRLKESEEKYRALIENLNEGILMIDVDTVISYVNDRMAELLAYTTGEMTGKHLFEFMDNKGRALAEERIRRWGQGIRQRQDFEFRRKDGSRMYATLEITPLTDGGGNNIGTLAGVMDITERKRAEEELKRANRELEAYASVVSHDLRAPLSVVESAGATLERMVDLGLGGVPAGEVAEVVGIINRSTRKAQRLIGDLLALARAGQEPEQVSLVEVSGVVEEIIREKAEQAEETEMEFLVDDDLGVVRADPTQIYQLFANLISNCIKYNDSPNPRVEILCRGEEAGGASSYMVRDNGSGFAEEEIETLFEAFTRGEKGDTGLGLAIAKKIVDVYGGEIRAYNDGGACFEFTLRDY